MSHRGSSAKAMTLARKHFIIIFAFLATILILASAGTGLFFWLRRRGAEKTSETPLRLEVAQPTAGDPTLELVMGMEDPREIPVVALVAILLRSEEIWVIEATVITLQLMAEL